MFVVFYFSAREEIKNLQDNTCEFLAKQPEACCMKLRDWQTA